MPKYEIMLILDPKSEITLVENLTQEIFKDDVTSVKKYDRTQLAYPINGSTTALYVLVNIETKPNLIEEFTRKVNINQSIWRMLAINLDSEREHKIKKHFRFSKKEDRKKFFGDRSDRSRKPEGQSFSKAKELPKTISEKE